MTRSAANRHRITSELAAARRMKLSLLCTFLLSIVFSTPFLTRKSLVEAKITIPFSNFLSDDDSSRQRAAAATAAEAMSSNSLDGAPSNGEPSLQQQQTMLQESLARLWSQYLKDTARLRATIVKLTRTTVGFLWQNVVLYKPPVGLVTAWTLTGLVTSGRLYRGLQGIAGGGRDDKGPGGGIDGATSELALRQRRGHRLDKHSGRALDLDQGDFCYQKYGGISRVRRRLASEALRRRWNPSDEVTIAGSEETGLTNSTEAILSLVDALELALKTDFVPGGSHADHVQRLLQPIAEAEETALELGLLPPNQSINGGKKNIQKLLDDDEWRILRVALQTAQVHVFDSTLRLIRDRLLRTSFRLGRSVKFWKKRVQSQTSLFPTSILNALNPIFRNFFAGGIEGDRMRLSLAEAAYKSEIQRLGRVLNFLAERPPDMSDANLTLAVQKSLVESEHTSETVVHEHASHSQSRPGTLNALLSRLPFSLPAWSGHKRFSNFALRYNADGRGKFSFQTYEGSVAISSASAVQVLLEKWDPVQQQWLDDSHAWTLQARSLIFDTINEVLETSVQSTMSHEVELAKCQSTWKPMQYATHGEKDSLLEQWTFMYDMAWEIGRLRRVGEGKSLKLKEVNIVQWLGQWDLLGLPSAFIKIYAASILHRRMLPYWPMAEKFLHETFDTSIEIFQTRFWIPVKDLVEELMNRQSNQLLTGVSLKDEETSLDNMLKDLGYGDGTPATRHDATLKATRQYESDMSTGLVRHAVGGRLIRLILVQVQQLKVGMLDAAKTIDVLFQANRFNIQLLAIIPATVIVWLGSKVVRRFLFTLRVKEIRPMRSVHTEMLEYLDNLEAILLLTDGNQMAKGENYSVPASRLMNEEQMGEFALAVYDYLLLLDYSSPQPFSNWQCDAIHHSLTEFLGKGGSLTRLTLDGQLRLIDLVKRKHQELSKYL